LYPAFRVGGTGMDPIGSAGPTAQIAGQRNIPPMPRRAPSPLSIRAHALWGNASARIYSLHLLRARVS
jgi:hypothetical protein